MSTTTYTAVRTAPNRIEVTASDGTEIRKGRIGGARAERAAVVIVVRCTPESPVEVFGCRADAAAGEAEAARLVTATTTRTRYGTVPVRPYALAVAVPVTDA